MNTKNKIYGNSLLILILSVLITIFVFLIVSNYNEIQKDFIKNKNTIIIIFCNLPFIILIIFSEINNYKNYLKSTFLMKEINEVQNKINEDFFSNLIKINFKYIDHYYLQTQQQADKSFRLCAMLSIIGIGAIISGITMMFIANSNASYITIGIGSIIEIISAVFFYFYNRTITSMDSYHKKLVLTQNIALALKMSQEIPQEHRTEIQTTIIKSLIENVNSLLVYENEVSNKLDEK